MKRNQWMLVAATLASSSLWAQQDSTRPGSMDEVIITANKTLQKQVQTGKVITVINQEQIVRSGSKSVAQLLQETAGITANGALNNAGTNISLYTRGASSGRTLILLDGVPMYDPSQINNEFDLNLIALNDVERIEVCRGAQSTLYGSDAIGGVINIITYSKQVSKKLEGQASILAGNYGTVRAQIKAQGKLGKLTYGVRYARNITDGFSSAHDSTDKKGFDRDTYAGDFTSARLQYQFNEYATISAFALSSVYKTDLDAGIFADEKDFSVAHRAKTIGTRFQYSKKKWQFTAQYQYSDITRKFLDDSASVGGFAKYTRNDYSGKSQFAEAYGQYQFSPQWQVTLGADFRYSSMNNQFLSISSFGPFESGFNDTAQHQYAIYANLRFHSKNEKLNVEAGARWNQHNQFGDNTTFTFNPSYQISPRWRVLGSIATGFKAPSLFQLYDGFSGNTELRAETSTNYEIGLQYQSKPWQSRLVYFNRNMKNGIDYNYINFKYFNFIQQKVQGIEWENTVRLHAKWYALVNYTYIDGQEETQNRTTNKDTITYSYLLRRPAHQLNVQLNYQPTPSVNLQVSTRFVSNRFDVGGYLKPDVSLASYWLFNALASWQITEQVRLFGDMQNISNTKFFDIRGYNSIPFMWQVGLHINW
jgi:vitamin B12 transporter